MTQPNIWIHTSATVLVLLAGLLLGISRYDWLAIWLAIGLVWGMEVISTAIKRLADEMSGKERSLIGQARDVAGFGVLLASATAVIIGLLVFLPYLLVK